MRDRSFLGFIIGSLAVAAILGLLQHFFRKGSQRARSSRELLTDLSYWGLTPLVTRTITRFATGALVVAVALAFGFGGGLEGAKRLLAATQAHSPLSQLPRFVQLVLAVAVADFVGYGVHRGFHRSRAWRFHAVHHSSKKLDWLAATRIHPVNDLAAKLALTVPLVLLGFDLTVLASVAPLLTIYALFIHADLPWSFGPLKYVIASPRFHRWHHTSERDGLDKNFAGLLPVWDLLFGTFFMPDRIPETFGVDDAMPEGLFGQLAWPFKPRGKKEEASPVLATPLHSKP